MLITLISPYIIVLQGAAWNLQQSLEGLGAISSNYIVRDPQGMIVSSYWSPAQSVAVILGLLFIAFVFFACAFTVAGYVISRKTGAAVAAGLLLMPAALNMLGLWPSFSAVPDSFVLGGTGVLGAGYGMACLMLLGVFAGWCVAIIFADLARVRDRFWHLYDHFWVIAGLLAGIFFVADSQVSRHATELQATSTEVKQASTYLLRQVESFDRWCRDSGLSAQASCRWASAVQQKLLDYSYDHESIFAEFGPQTSADIYAIGTHRAQQSGSEEIRAEIGAYNQGLCPVQELGEGFSRDSPSSLICRSTPGTLCQAFPDPLGGLTDKMHIHSTKALDTECLIPTLVLLRKREAALMPKVKTDQMSRHYRWLYYLFFSFASGGKIAGSTIKLASMGSRGSTDGRRSVHLARRIGVILKRLLKCGYRALVILGKCLLRGARIFSQSLWRMVTRLRAYLSNLAAK